MYVVKRDGRREAVHFDKVTCRIKKLCYGLSPLVEPELVSQKVCMGVYKGVTTTELDELAAETAAHLTSTHPDYGLLAARISISNLQKNTSKSFTETISLLYKHVDARGLSAPLVSQTTYDIVMKHADALNSAIIYARDYQFDYFGYKTLERSYLLKSSDGRIVERPQHMLMRVAVGMHGDDIDAAIETYDLMSQKLFVHASPTLFNAGTPQPQLSSCFLVTMKDDSIEGIYDTLKTCALISKSSGGVGLAVHNIRATGSYIRGTNGTSNGLVPMLRVFNDTARFVNQGGGKRKGSFAVYLEPWHADILEFLDLKKNHGAEEVRARDLFLALWISDLFMERVEADAAWSLFCPNESPGLADCHGEAFKELYTKYERLGKAKKVIKARTVWNAILQSQTESGTPYILYKDACNAKSNQQNLGTIHCSNLCTEIIQFTSPDEVAVCNLASVALSRFVEPDGQSFNHKRLCDVVKVMTRNLNKVIDINAYPVEEARNSNLRHRPIGLGVQGLADAFMLMRLPFDSPAAAELNKAIFETIYFAALSASVVLAKKHGPYASYAGSPVSRGILQPDMWDVKTSDRWDWAALRKDIAQYGVRNSLLVAPMPTAATSQILGNNECFEPYTSNIYSRRTLAGEFVVVNPFLLKDLIRLGLWSDRMKQRLIAANGSIQHMPDIPDDIKSLYKTVWEIKAKTLIDMAADRAPFIDQSQSLNIFMSSVSNAKLTSMHFYAWKKGLKTGTYYLRTQAAADAIKFTVDRHTVETTEPTHLAKSFGVEAKREVDRTPVRTQPREWSTPHVAQASRRLFDTPASTTSTTTTSSEVTSPGEMWMGDRDSVTGSPSVSSVGGNTSEDEHEHSPPFMHDQPAPSAARHPVGMPAAVPSTVPPMTDRDAEEAARIRSERERQRQEMVCSLDNREACLSCGS